jgi:TolA protein
MRTKSNRAGFSPILAAWLLALLPAALLAQEPQRMNQTSEAEPQRNLAQEEQDSAASREHNESLRATWARAILAHIMRNWNKPPRLSTDFRCELRVTQEPGGKVTNVTLGSCNGDQAVKESILAAIYGASPLPAPPDPSVFDRILLLTFRP